jgi:hypothetical protein
LLLVALFSNNQKYYSCIEGYSKISILYVFYNPVDDLVEFDQEPDLWWKEICGGNGVHGTKLKEN